HRESAAHFSWAESHPSTKLMALTAQKGASRSSSVMNIISRGTGKTSTERHLSKLADKSFLNLWSYANVFNDKRPAPKAQGQELCDVLVVCDPYVLVFSDKHVAWPGDEKLSLNWT